MAISIILYLQYNCICVQYVSSIIFCFRTRDVNDESVYDESVMMNVFPLPVQNNVRNTDEPRQRYSREVNLDNTHTIIQNEHTARQTVGVVSPHRERECMSLTVCECNSNGRSGGLSERVADACRAVRPNFRHTKQ